jgi:hypothetical protein
MTNRSQGHLRLLFLIGVAIILVIGLNLTFQFYGVGYPWSIIISVLVFVAFVVYTNIEL